METSFTHGGNVYQAAKNKNISIDQLIDFSANINPLGPPEWLRACISRSMDDVVHYPDPYASALTDTIATSCALNKNSVIAANGSTELLYLLPRLLTAKRALIPVPCYVDYIKVMELAGIQVQLIPLAEQDSFVPNLLKIESMLLPGDILVLANPNNPTGATFDVALCASIAKRNPEVTFIIDEAFLAFAAPEKSLAGTNENIITLHSLTKFYAIPGLRLGYGVFPVSVALRMQKAIPPWSVNGLAQAVGTRCLQDIQYQQRSRDYLEECKNEFSTGLHGIDGLQVFPTTANYFLLKTLGTVSVRTIAEKLHQKNILIRGCDNYINLGENYFRIAIRTKSENALFLEQLTKICNPTKGRTNNKIQKKPALMFQGTSSNAGKSILTAALCRILLQDGVKVAPFKAQNMSLNSFVTLDGLEMGRAQVVQAQAARVDPDVRMNPVLLKPNSDTGSQVIVRGKSVGNMAVLEYVKYKKQLMGEVCSCYDELAAEYDAIVLEGAGSPGEVNLKKDDIVNMRMARHAESPVLLVGDIDRGGVYASFVGTMEVLNQWERRLVTGFVVNRFRGNATLLDDAHDYLKMHTGKEVFGVIPHIDQHGIPEEDSVSFKEGIFKREKPTREHIEIVVINLPHISNFTDIEPFLLEDDVYLRVVNTAEDIGTPDVVILPGSKNVIGDLQTLNRSGIANRIQNLAGKGVEIVGICGGYQMLGQQIHDPHTIESNAGSIDGLSLLVMDTELAKEKTLIRRTGMARVNKKAIFGYEIHHGQTRTSSSPLFDYDDKSSCGTSSSDGKIWGCYLHGLFDSDEYRRTFIDSVRKRKNLLPYDGICPSYNLEFAFDRLADTVRSNMDMDAIYKLLGL